MSGTDATAGGLLPAVGARLGSFELTEPAGSWGGQTRFQARGAPGTPHDDAPALVLVAPKAGDSGPALDAAVARLDAIARVRHENVASPLETGAWEGGLYLAHELPAAATLAGRLTELGAIPPADAVRLIDGLAAALDALATAGVPHGDVRLANVWLRPDARPVIGGFVIGAGASPSAAADAVGLAALLASLLSGRPLTIPTAGEAAPGWEPPPGLPEAVQSAVRRGIGPDPARRYPSPGDLAAAYRESIAAAATIQVAGAWEAIERRDYPMARLICEAALALRPDDREVRALLRHVGELATGGPAVAPLDRFSLLPGAGVTERPDRIDPAPPIGPAGVASLPPELAELLAVQPPAKPDGSSAWATLATGMVLLVALALVAALVSLSYR